MNANPHNCYARITSDTKVYPAFSMSTLPPPDVTRGTTKAVDAVLEPRGPTPLTGRMPGSG